MTPTRKKILGILVTLASTVIFGLHPNAARAVYADGGNAVFVILAVTATRTLGLLSLALVLGKPLFRAKADTHTAITGGFFQALSGTCTFLSLMFLSGPIFVIIFHFSALMLLFFTIWRGEAKLTPIVALTTFGALAGLTLVVNVWRADQELSVIGIGLAFASAMATATRMYIYGHLTRQRSPAVVGAEAFVFATLFVMLLLLFKAPAYPASTEGWLWLAAGCAASTVGTFGMFYGIALLGAFEYSLLSKLEPIFTSLFAVLLIGEYLAPLQYLGMAVVIASLMAYQYGEHRRKARL